MNMGMNHWAMQEIYLAVRAEELRQWRSQPVPPPKPRFWTSWRQRLAQGLVGLGLRLDAEASRAAVACPETAPQLDGSDA